MKYLLLVLSLSAAPLCASQSLTEPLNDISMVLDMPSTPPHAVAGHAPSAPFSFEATRTEFAQILEMVKEVEAHSWGVGSIYFLNAQFEIEAMQAITGIYGALDDLSRSFPIQEKVMLMRKVNRYKIRLMRAVTEILKKLDVSTLQLDEALHPENQPNGGTLNQARLNEYRNKLDILNQVYASIAALGDKLDAVQRARLESIALVLNTLRHLI